MSTIFKEMQRIYCALAVRYFDDTTVTVPPLSAAYMWLSADIESILVNHGLDKREEILAIINGSPYAEEILSKYIFMNKIEEAATIRTDFDTALAGVKHGAELSAILGWGFSSRDIRELALLHRAGKHKEKIEDLLEDCNFHSECGDFSEGNYEPYI